MLTTPLKIFDRNTLRAVALEYRVQRRLGQGSPGALIRGAGYMERHPSIDEKEASHVVMLMIAPVARDHPKWFWSGVRAAYVCKTTERRQARSDQNFHFADNTGPKVHCLNDLLTRLLERLSKPISIAICGDPNALPIKADGSYPIARIGLISKSRRETDLPGAPSYHRSHVSIESEMTQSAFGI